MKFQLEKLKAEGRSELPKWMSDNEGLIKVLNASESSADSSVTVFCVFNFFPPVTIRNFFVADEANVCERNGRKTSSSYRSKSCPSRAEVERSETPAAFNYGFLVSLEHFFNSFKAFKKIFGL